MLTSSPTDKSSLNSQPTKGSKRGSKATSLGQQQQKQQQMAEEGSESSVATSSSTPSWWELQANPPSSWANMNPWHHQNHKSNSCEEDMSISNSFTNASNHSGLSIDDSSRELVESASAVTELSGEPTSASHLWRQVLLSFGTGGDLNNGHDDGENFLKALSSKNLTMDLFEPDLKKFDNCWEFTNPTSFNSMEKQLNGYDGSLIEHERLTHLSDLVSNWSIAPPDPQLDRQIAPATCNISLNSSMDLYLESSSSLPQLKQEPQNPSLYLSNGGLGNRNSGYMPCYGHDVKVESQHHGVEASEGAFLRPFNGNGTGYQMGHANSVVGDNSKCYYGMLDVPWSNPRAFSDYISFSGCLNKPLVDFQASKPCIKGSNSPDSKKQGHETSSSARGNGRGSGISSEGKKKRSEDNSDTTVFKKPKNENSTVSSLKIQAPKVKLGDRITALQQIVSPFGKTDTASVLLEAIGYIKFLQEQVQLLSNPYMKANANKDHSPWGGLERKDKSEPKHDLKSRGLCLVPISCTPQVYRENTGSDYWTPTYRGCLYR